MLRKDVYPHEYNYDWKNVNETSLPEKECFHSHLTVEDITNADYAFAKRVCQEFQTKNLGEYYDLYVQSNTLLLAVIFENFQNISFEIYEVDPTPFLSTTRLVSQAALEKTKTKLDLFTDIDMLLMVEKGIRGAICHDI